MFDDFYKEIKTYTKEEMWKELCGRTVKCIHTQDGKYQLFAVQDLESKKIYLLDEKRG